MGVLAKRIFVGDYETTVYPNQKSTEVWASALVELHTENVEIYNSIKQTFDYIFSLDCNTLIYYHNLKFDGSFILSYLLLELEFAQAYDTDNKRIKFKNMSNKSFNYSISAMGAWYNIIIKYKGKKIEIRDSLKLLPFSVDEIGRSFGTKHRKMDMDYEGFRFAGCEITPEEKEYIRNDVLVVKEALEILYRDGHNKMTIGSCCMSEFKNQFHKHEYYKYFPDLYKVEINKEYLEYNTVGEYIHASYKGGWCYLARGAEQKVYDNGTTVDVNSLYPSMMHSMSGNRYPIGYPTFWYGDYIPDIAQQDSKFYFVKIRTKFKLKDGYLPFIQIKRNKLYKANDCLDSSDVFYNGKYYEEIKDRDGNKRSTHVVLTLTQTDFILIKEHYHLIDLEILSGCYFSTEIGLFDSYMEKYKKQKQESQGAIREEAKLFLNNLYGKMASSKDSSFKLAYVKDDGSLGFKLYIESDKEPGYIPIGSAITSYARNFTIRAAQKNYYGPDKRGFKYADTDSLHCDLPPEDLIDIPIHDTEFCHWSIDGEWDKALFSRQKTYIEHIVKKKNKLLEDPYYDIKCAGMPKKCQNYFALSMTGFQLTPEIIRDMKIGEEEIKFIERKRDITDFCKGLIVPGKLMPKRIRGGIILKNTTYEMR